MKKIVISIAAAAGLAACFAAPAMAQVDVYAGPGGVGVGLGTPGYAYGPQHGYVDPGHNGWHGGHRDHGVHDHYHR